jgi:hypothetical protein
MPTGASSRSRPFTREDLNAENTCFQGTGGVSRENCGYGFQPAFLDVQTQTVYLSRFADGRPAPLSMSLTAYPMSSCSHGRTGACQLSRRRSSPDSFSMASSIRDTPQREKSPCSRSNLVLHQFGTFSATCN